MLNLTSLMALTLGIFAFFPLLGRAYGLIIPLAFVLAGFGAGHLSPIARACADTWPAGSETDFTGLSFHATQR